MNSYGKLSFCHPFRKLMKNNLLFLVLAFICSALYFSCKTKPSKSFSEIPARLSYTEDLIRSIVPDQRNEYWVCIRQDVLGKIHPKNEIITGKGNISYLTISKINVPKDGFINEMWQGYYYIAYSENESIKIVKNEEQFVKFIGKINSLEKALLIAKMRGLSVDYSRPIGSSYRRIKSGFELYLARFHKCTIRTEPFKVSIDTLGNFKSESLNFYYDVDENTCAD